MSEILNCQVDLLTALFDKRLMTRVITLKESENGYKCEFRKYLKSVARRKAVGPSTPCASEYLFFSNMLPEKYEIQAFYRLPIRHYQYFYSIVIVD